MCPENSLKKKCKHVCTLPEKRPPIILPLRSSKWLHDKGTNSHWLRWYDFQWRLMNLLWCLSDFWLFQRKNMCKIEVYRQIKKLWIMSYYEQMWCSWIQMLKTDWEFSLVGNVKNVQTWSRADDINAAGCIWSEWWNGTVQGPGGDFISQLWCSMYLILWKQRI